MKTLDDYFTDWESHVFGFGYGTGEQFTLQALRRFFDSFNEDQRTYNYETLEKNLTATVAWLLINILCKVDILEYGTSARYGWLTAKGERLAAFVKSKPLEELWGLTSKDENYIHCYPDACNCGPNGYEKDRVCQNPFWRNV